MNYYDISNPNAPFTTGYQKGLWQKRIVQIYRVLVMIGGILGVCFIIGTGQREDYTMGMLESCMLLLVSYLVFLIMLMYASIIISAKKTEKWNLQDKHDYNLALYRTRYKDNKQLQAVTLIQMAKQQILMGHYDLAIQALEMVRTDCLKLQYLREFYFYKAAALYLSDKHGWEEVLNNCYAIPPKSKQMTNDEIAFLFSPRCGKMDLQQTIYNHNQIRRKWPVLLIITAVLVLYAGFFYGIIGLLPEGYHYRSWYQMSSIMLTSAGCIILSLLWIIKLILFKDNISTKSNGVKIFQNSCLVVMWFCLMAALVIYQIMAFIGMDEELAEYPGGLIYMSSGNGYVSEDYYNLKVGPFLRKNLTTKEYIEYGLESELNGTDESQNGANSSDDENQKDINDSDNENQKGTNNSENSDQGNSVENDTQTEDFSQEQGSSSDESKTTDTESAVFAESLAVYQYMMDTGEITDGDPDKVSYGFTAKGSFYAIFETDDSNGVTCEKHLVYDRVSENGKCDLFVYQQEQVGADAKILGFYAVKKGTGQVISADKTTWGGVSSKEYQDATGEN